MDDWDSPKRSRLFLAAAMLTAACGFMLTNDRFEPPRLTQNGDLSAPATLEARSATPDALAAQGRPASSGPEDLARSESPAAADLRDAVASPALTGLQQAARSAAFAGPAGRVAGAFAPASAQSALAARHALEPRSGGPASAAAVSTAAVASTPAGPRAAYAAAGLPSGRAAVDVRRSTQQLSPAEKLFAAPERGLPRVSTRGAIAAGTAPFAPASAARSRGLSSRPARPTSLARLLGKGALKAPVGARPPSGDPWSRPIPAAGPDGRPLSAKPLGEAAAETVAPPSLCRKKGAHWDVQAEVSWFHDGPARGRLAGGSWAWLEQKDAHWWLWPMPKRPPLVNHADHWWLKSRGLWFLLHDGAPWGWQYMREWDSQGFVHSSGSQMIYSSDGERLGIVVPGEGAILYDARTGGELGRWSEEELPRRRDALPSRLPSLP